MTVDISSLATMAKDRVKGPHSLAFRFFLGLGIEALRVKDPNNGALAPNFNIILMVFGP